MRFNGWEWQVGFLIRKWLWLGQVVLGQVV